MLKGDREGSGPAVRLRSSWSEHQDGGPALGIPGGENPRVWTCRKLIKKSLF